METGITSRPDSASVRLLLARAYRNNSQNSQATRHYQWLLRQEQPSIELLTEAANLDEQINLNWEARNVRERLRERKTINLQNNPSNPL